MFIEIINSQAAEAALALNLSFLAAPSPGSKYLLETEATGFSSIA
jgi:hypothetical protein